MQTVHHDASQYEVIPPRPAPPLPFKHKYRVLAPGGQLLHRDFHTVTKQFITITLHVVGTTSRHGAFSFSHLSGYANARIRISVR